MSIALSTLSAQKACAKWNTLFPVGTLVRYWRGLREGRGLVGKTRSSATVVCGTAVVWIEGCCGCVAISHVEPQI